MSATSYARVENGVVQEILSLDAATHDAFSPEVRAQLVAIPSGVTPHQRWTWNGTSFAAPSAPAVPVPDAVSAAQARIALSRAGKLDDVTAAVNAAGGEVEIWFEYATTWERQNPHVVALGEGIGLSSGQIDDLFVEAVQIAA